MNSEPSKTANMELFAEIVNILQQLLTNHQLFCKSSDHISPSLPDRVLEPPPVLSKPVSIKYPVPLIYICNSQYSLSHAYFQHISLSLFEVINLCFRVVSCIILFGNIYLRVRKFWFWKDLILFQSDSMNFK